MPPKTFKRSQVIIPRPEEKGHNEESSNQALNLTNPQHQANNFSILSQMRVQTAILAGSICGILNMNQIVSPFFFIGLQLLLTLLIVIATKNYRDYFNKLSEVSAGIVETTMMFICSWMISYNLVHHL